MNMFMHQIIMHKGERFELGVVHVGQWLSQGNSTHTHTPQAACAHTKLSRSGTGYTALEQNIVCTRPQVATHIRFPQTLN